MLAQAGDMTRAVTIMQQFTEQHERTWTLMKIATTQMQADNMIEARETFATAVTAAQKIIEEEVRARALLSIARAQGAYW